MSNNLNDLTFFTNEPERNLYDRFIKILKSGNTQFFDVLVGYFRASGFYLLQDSLDEIEKTRILIGINTDKQILEMFQEYHGNITEIGLSTKESIDRYKKQLTNEFEKSEDSELVENGVNKFIELLKSKKLELRIYTNQPIHAKIYIMRDNPITSPDVGRVITGSSNFSQAGLVNNLEFNVELKNSADVRFATEKFDELWNDSVEINEICISTIENNTWIKKDITPYEMYVKFLYEYFKEEINDDQYDILKSRKVYPEGFKLLRYQKDAVIQAKRKIAKHNGIFISDVVGLGKTYICALLAQELEGKKLFLCPPVLCEYWENVLFQFEVKGAKVESHGKLKNIIEDGISDFDYVFVDESHRFRNAETENYKLLHQICMGKKVILISATPQNNYHRDIANQLYLFQSRSKSTIVTARNLENFFDNLKRKVNSYVKGSKEQKEAIREASEEIRNKVLRDVMIRRTRTEIQKVYGEDLKKQKLKFPKVSEPIKLAYEFDDETELLFNKTIKNISELNYSRYKPMTYVKESHITPALKSLLVGQKNMGGFMKSILIKRLESSKYAFSMTLNRFINSYKDFIRMYEAGTVLISKKLNVEDLLENDDIDILLQAVEREDAFIFTQDDFNEQFINDLRYDLAILEEVKTKWNLIKHDCKLDYFIKVLKETKQLKKQKILVFSESKETVDYLQKEIFNRIGENAIKFSGSMPDTIRKEIRENFDPNSSNPKDDYRILITTDVLAEGINLHRSNVIINYDLPWNPTRIMQRVGRVNRVGTSFDEIFIFNFFPTSKSNEALSLEDNIKTKMQMFHDILGDDAKYLTDDEELSTHELFDKISSVPIDDEDEPTSELSYLKVIRDIRDNDNELFTKIKSLPKKIKIGRNKSDDIECLITFFRKGYLKRFYEIIDDEPLEVTFEDAIEAIKADKKEKSIPVKKDYYTKLKLNKKKFDESEQEDLNLEIISFNKRGSSNAKDIIKILKECLKLESRLTDVEVDNLKKIKLLLENGELPTRILKDGKKLIKQIESEKDIIKFYKEFEKLIPNIYFTEETKSERTDKTKLIDTEIILSEYIMQK